MQGENILRNGTNCLLNHPAFSMQQCKCVDIHRNGKRMPSDRRRTQQEAVPTGSTLGATGGKIKEFHLAGIELYDSSYSSIHLLLRPLGTRRRSLATTVDLHALKSLHGKCRVV